MLLIRSPSIIFAFIFSIFSILLTILTVNIGYNHPQQQIQFLIILPPINCIFLFLFSLIWIERRFRLSYIPFICLIILLTSCLTLTIISYLYLLSSIILYFNFIFYLFITILLFLIILIMIISYFYNSLCSCCYRHMISMEQQNNQLSITNDTCQFDKFLLKSNDNEFFLFISKLSNQHIDYDINNLVDSLNEINVDIVLTLNETNKFSYMNITNNKNSHIDLYSMHFKRANIEHIIYPIYDHCIPKSVSDYMQFLYSIIINFNHNNLFIHYMGRMERIGMTIVCFELLYNYIMNENEQKKEQKFIERVCHYPLLLENYCRVCQSISNVRKIRPTSIHNPLQILYVHEFYARLKSVSYMEHIKNIINLNEKYVMNYFEELHGPINM
ncbi:unnamed protein product [Rotaria sp. Silwood2]|nr:unnamed protein product [Rotaria sp. Silwood2]CAF2883421.1 unnamed protein product [Rotaria sp. Silwood2]CAF4420489.1 unnamed protein product [Rotaria sp. Silwood2]CAF4557860.1 unnamed protein product [Rotaria sp. Silwood2]